MISVLPAPAASAVQSNSGYNYNHCITHGLLDADIDPEASSSVYTSQDGKWIRYNGYTTSFYSLEYKALKKWGKASGYVRAWDLGEGVDLTWIGNNKIYHDCVVNCSGASGYSQTLASPSWTETPVLTGSPSATWRYKGTIYWGWS